ncbi:MAG: glutamine synthetase family protein [Candidatus Nanoarchaeia archaeon]|nr:glutamine synthetase family protein [Candidatus Nanoarchaeia archaeon]
MYQTFEEVKEIIEKEGVSSIELQFSDIHGRDKIVEVPSNKIKNLIEGGCWFDGSSVEGYGRIMESDKRLKPILNTFAILPWRNNHIEKVGRFICEIYNPDGSRYEGDPRYILEKVVKEARAKGFIYNVGPEPEFFILNQDFNPHDQAGYFDSDRDLGKEIRMEIVRALKSFNIEFEASHHEVSKGQHEIDFEYSDALTTADNIMTFKRVVRSVVKSKALIATFMPKPFIDKNGNGMHVHQSLFNFEGKNLFFDQNDKYHLSGLAYNFMAGQIDHIRAITALANSTVNSYKRLIPGYEAPTRIAWGQRNRSALIRVPDYTPGKEDSVRFELRSPDPMCNPYLVFAVMLKAGLDGIEKNLTPPPPVEGSLYELNEEELLRRNIEVLPKSLRRAIEDLEKDYIIDRVLGSLLEDYSFTKRKDYRNYHEQITEWEKKVYL